MKRVYIVKPLGFLYVCILVFMVDSIQSCYGQIQNKEFIYDRAGAKIYFDEIKDTIHLGFSECAPIFERDALLDDISSIADRYMLLDSSYCITVIPGYETQLKTTVSANNHVAYCQNEYCDSLGGVVWGDC